MDGSWEISPSDSQIFSSRRTTVARMSAAVVLVLVLVGLVGLVDGAGVDCSSVNFAQLPCLDPRAFGAVANDPSAWQKNTQAMHAAFANATSAQGHGAVCVAVSFHKINKRGFHEEQRAGDMAACALLAF